MANHDLIHFVFFFFAAAPIIEGWSKEMSDVVFLKVDVDVNEEGAEEYNVSAMPTFIFFQNGVKVSVSWDDV